MTLFGLQAKDVKCCLPQMERKLSLEQLECEKWKMCFQTSHSEKHPLLQYWALKSLTYFSGVYTNSHFWYCPHTCWTMARSAPRSPTKSFSHLPTPSQGGSPFTANDCQQAILEQLSQIGHVHLGNQLSVKSITMKCSTWLESKIYHSAITSARSAGAGTALG